MLTMIDPGCAASLKDQITNDMKRKRESEGAEKTADIFNRILQTIKTPDYIILRETQNKRGYNAVL